MGNFFVTLVFTRDRNGANFLLPASSRSEKTSHRPDSLGAESLFCSPLRLDPRKTFTRPTLIRKGLLPAPPRLQKIHLFFENIIYLIIQYKGSVNKIGTHAEKCVQ